MSDSIQLDARNLGAMLCVVPRFSSLVYFSSAVLFCCVFSSAAIAEPETQSSQIGLPRVGAPLNTKSQPIAQGTRKVESSYTVQGKPATKEQFEAGKLLDEGLILLRSNSNEQALKKFKDSVAAYDGYAEVHHAMGLAYAKMGNNQEAIKELKRATELKPDLDESWISLAGFYQAGGNLQEAVNAYTEFLTRFPTNPNVAKVNVSLGVLYAKLGRNEDAINELKHSIELNPDLSSSWVSLGGVYQAKGDLNNAIESYSEFSKRFPKDPLAPKVSALLIALQKERKKQNSLRSQDRALLPGIESASSDPINSGGTQTINPQQPVGKNANDDYLFTVMERDGGVKRWPSSRIPVTVYIGDSSKASGFRDSMKTILKRSFDDWAKASNGGISFTYLESPANARLKVFWTDKNSDLKNVSEAGDARLFMDQSYIRNAEIWFLTQPLNKTMPLTDNVFRLVALHEIGHALGLSGHTSNPDDIMFYSATFKDSWRELSGRDARSISRLYHSDL